MQSDNQIIYEKYSDKSIVLRGDATKNYKTDLVKLGGLYNSRLKCGPGWIFSLKSEEKVLNWLKTQNINTQQKTDNLTVEQPKQLSTSVLFEQIKHVFQNMNYRERITFITDISKIASSTELITEKPCNNTIDCSLNVKRETKESNSEESNDESESSDASESSESSDESGDSNDNQKKEKTKSFKRLL